MTKVGVHVRAKHCDKQIPLVEAIKNGFVTIFDDQLIAMDNTMISISSRLYDCNHNEIFEHDLVRDTDGRKYEVIYDFGCFYLKNLDGDQALLPLYIYKLNNTIDVELC